MIYVIHFLSEKQKFQEIVQEIRSDLELLETCQAKLSWELVFNDDILLNTFAGNQHAPEIGKWIADVYLDKLFEAHSKTKKFLAELNLKENDNSGQLVQNMKVCLAYITNALTVQIFKNEKLYKTLRDSVTKVDGWIKNYRSAFEVEMIIARSHLYETNWVEMKKIKLEDYTLPITRKTYVKARDELEKAIQAVKTSQWEEVLNHLRPAIDIAIKEKFGFNRINPMKVFLTDAESSNFPLPSYTMLYDYFDEGSHRIHSGKLNTPYECQKALEFVAGFIDQLELIDVPKEVVEEFKKKCRAVE
jgi:hypothetical protein